jgi:drug/metabolite transporter (DMT)-like permease
MDKIAFALIAALAAGSYSVLQRATAAAVHQAFGALLISLTAAAISALVLFFTFNTRPLYYDAAILPWIALIGLAAFFVDYFTLLAYSRGLSVSVGNTLFVGVSIATASLVGLAIGEQITALKLLGIALVTAGAIILGVS